MRLKRIAKALVSLEPQPVAVSLPTLPFPPVFYTRPAQLSSFEAGLRSAIAEFSASLAVHTHLRVLSATEVDRQSPPSLRFDLKSELAAGFPYSMEHADTMASLLAGLMRPSARKKGIISDLDDTLWRGILGEIGATQVSWSLEGHAQIHGLYQQLLASMAASGTLVGIASKNQRTLVDEALGRRDLLLPQERIFPIEANWGTKSQSVARTLHAWNIGPEDVVFVDDSLMELAEVEMAYPAMECILFPKDDPNAAWNFLYTLRERFGVAKPLEEDSLRTDSLRSTAVFQSEIESGSTDFDAFLAHAKAEITLSCSKEANARAFELVNKTNQFNLNGERLSESDWNALLASGDRFVLKASYQDRFGALGTIAVLAGTRNGESIEIDHWVMSCRAFSRRIEYKCLAWIFDHFDAEEVDLRFRATPRNGPMQEFLATFFGPQPWGSHRIRHAHFQDKCPMLYHSLLETA